MGEIDIFGIKFGGGSERKASMKVYEIKIEEIIKKFNIPGKVVYSSYNYKTKILELKVKEE